MPASPAGEESLTDAIASQAIEAQPSFGQIKPLRGRVVRASNSILGEKTWRTSCAARKRLGIPGEEMDTVAHRKDGLRAPPPARTATLREGVSVGLTTERNRERSNEGRDVADRLAEPSSRR